MREVKKIWLESKTVEFVKGGKAAKAQEVPERWVGASSRAGRCPARARPMAALEKPSPSEWAARCRAGCSVPSASRGQLCPPASRPPHPAGGGHGGGSRTPPRRGTRGCRGRPGFRRRVPSAPGFSAPCWGQARPWAPAGFRGCASPGILPPGGVSEGGVQGASGCFVPVPDGRARRARVRCQTRLGDAGYGGAGRDLGAAPAQPRRLRRPVRGVCGGDGAGGPAPPAQALGQGGGSACPPGLKGEHGRAAVAVAGEESEATQPELI